MRTWTARELLSFFAWVVSAALLAGAVVVHWDAFTGWLR